MDRRRFLATVGASGFSGLAGCGDDSQVRNSTTEAVGTEGSDSTPEPPSPELEDLDYALDDPEQAVGTRSIHITGSAKFGETGSIDFSLNGDRKRTSRKESFDFSIEISGGERYTLTVVTANDAGTTERQFNVGYVPEPTDVVGEDRLIGAHYYVWWGADWHWNDGYPGTPVLGEYNARNPEVIDQHVTWAIEHGINWFCVSWWGEDSWSDITLRDHFPQAERSKEISISILYEPHATLNITDGWRVDFDDPANRQQFVEEIQYLAETYFDRENYLHIDGRPVLYVYLGKGFMGDFSGAMAEAVSKAGVTPYFIGDLGIVVSEPVNWDKIRAFDAISDYASFYDDRPDVTERYPEAILDAARQWMLALDRTDVDYIPDLGPGFDKSHHSDGGDLAVLDPTTEEFADFCRGTLRQMDPNVDAALITSFNEWYEGTVVEPTEEDGTQYLEVVRDALASPKTTYENRDRYGAVTVEFDELVPEAELNPDAGRFARDLGFMLLRVELLDTNDRTLTTYDIGSEPEPIFVEGGFDPNQHEGDTWRWLGGPTGQTVFLVPWEKLSAARSVRLYGNPPNHPTSVSADVSIDHLGSDVVEFDDGRSEYLARLPRSLE